MNEALTHFQFFDLPLSFHIDEQLLKNKFYANSKQYHPDFHINQSEQEQEQVLALAAQNNIAYKILSDPNLRFAYLLKILNVLDDNENYQLPQSFLMEMMELNEQLMECNSTPNEGHKSQLIQEIKQRNQALQTEQENYFSAFEATNLAIEKQQLLLSLKELFFRKKYLLRIQEKLHKFATSC